MLEERTLIHPIFLTFLSYAVLVAYHSVTITLSQAGLLKELMKQLEYMSHSCEMINHIGV